MRFALLNAIAAMLCFLRLCRQKGNSCLHKTTSVTWITLSLMINIVMKRHIKRAGESGPYFGPTTSRRPDSILLSDLMLFCFHLDYRMCALIMSSLPAIDNLLRAARRELDWWRVLRHPFATSDMEICVRRPHYVSCDPCIC